MICYKRVDKKQDHFAFPYPMICYKRVEKNKIILLFPTPMICYIGVDKKQDHFAFPYPYDMLYRGREKTRSFCFFLPL